MSRVITFPADASGRPSSSAFGRSVVADALRAVSGEAAAAAEAEPDWRRGYLTHFRALVELGVSGGTNRDGDSDSGTNRDGDSDGDSDSAGYAIAAAGLDAVHRLMPVPIGEPARPFETVTVEGSEKPALDVSLPYRGELLRGAALDRRLDEWVAAGVVEESCAHAVRAVADHPDWLDLSDQQLVVLGAGAEMGPLPAVLGWGATVIGVDLPRVWERVSASAARSAGRLIAPVGASGTPGADLLEDVGALAHWLADLPAGRIVLGNYGYAPGAAYPRLSVAVDALTTYLQGVRDDVVPAFLATPTDVFAVPAAAVGQATARFHERSRLARVTGALSGGRLLRPNYPDGADPGINDSLVPQQGPNYALAKRIQRWRATVARRTGTVSFAVAPPTRTRSVVSNRLLAAAYAGAHRFDVEVFEPGTANRLMALLLVHQLRNPRPAAPEAWRDETVEAAHGGLWRTAYHPRTALGLAAVRGLLPG
ncbi:hypothetical protein Ade02nite_01350 [Paractinoplanes deccanensis]|uniref:Class I SAM-dependent methyltransferase n=1 Tax=Paractinoplanes deccanensis TaxID=113561 RepID=A0ABQ3XUR5_9ACTN|nr:hypothetical protein [Actinoplanes deccanensis]GID71494.1 hypothetical protein Ade02nite_01350 [Actinoplanes deccanensis]